MYLGLVLIVMIVTGSYILISMQNTEIDKARDSLSCQCTLATKAK